MEGDRLLEASSAELPGRGLRCPARFGEGLEEYGEFERDEAGLVEVDGSFTRLARGNRCFVGPTTLDDSELVEDRDEES